MTRSPRTSSERKHLLQRAGYYLIGVSLGFLMLGLMWRFRDREAAERRFQYEQWMQTGTPQTPSYSKPEPRTAIPSDDTTPQVPPAAVPKNP